MNQKLISVIVPVFNAEKYIHKCIQSILSQSYNFWELILIDDGSRDNSGKICDEYSRKYENIYVIHKKNEGAERARYGGLRYAKGEIIAFVDADDWVQEDYLMGLVEGMIADPQIDISIGRWIKEENGQYTRPLAWRHPGYLSAKEAMYQILLGKYMDEPLWGKLYRKKLFDGFGGHLDRVRGEDLGDNWEFLHRAEAIYYSGNESYVHVINPLSITRRFHPDDEVGLIETLAEIYEEITYEGEKKDIQHVVSLRLLQTYAEAMRCMTLMDREKYREIIVMCDTKYRKVITNIISSLSNQMLRDTYIERFSYGVPKMEEKYDELMQFIMRSPENVYIYGAGRYAQKIGKILASRSVEFSSFVIGNEQEIKQFPDNVHEVIHLKDLASENVNKSILLIGMGVMNTLDVLEDLHRYPFYKILIW